MKKPPRAGTSKISVSGLDVQIDRKPIKNLHVGVYPPAGRVRVAAPVAMDNTAVRLAVIAKLGWIKRQRAAFAAQPRQTAREMASGESHYYRGRRYRLRVLTNQPTNRIRVVGSSVLELAVTKGTGLQKRAAILSRWYRDQLRATVTPLVEQWQESLGVSVASWGIRRMKTKWGSCNPRTKRILFNLELAKKHPNCVEYLVVHELLHLIERHHTDRFDALMDKNLPKWRQYRKTLNAEPLGHEDWAY